MTVRLKPIFALVLAAACASPAAAQKAPNLFSWNEEAGWSVDATGLGHKSGLKCPSAVWKGLGDVAPVGFDNDSAMSVPTLASCQYYTYWDQGTPKETRLVFTLLETTDLPAYLAAWSKSSFSFGEPVAAGVKRGVSTYRTIRWKIDRKHWMTAIVREGTRPIVVMAVTPDGYADEPVWTIVDGLFAANP